MKAIIIFLFCLVFISFCQDTKLNSETFENHYSMVELINKLDVGWKAKFHPKFAIASKNDIKSMLGSLQTPATIRLPRKKAADYSNAADPPEQFDSRTQWPKCESIKEIRDQSKCGSCWAFAVVEALSDRICVSSGQTKQTRISATDLLSCCSSCGYGCDGGYPSEAWSYFQNTGICTGDLYNTKEWCEPYPFPPCAHHLNVSKYPACPDQEYPTPSCSKKCQTGYPTSYAQDKIKGKSSYWVDSDEKVIRQEIMTKGPVSAAFTVYEDFMWYHSGVYRHVTGSSLGGHAIKIIGWGVENNVKYWIVVNSWNEDWGDQGIFKIVRGENHVGIEDEINAGDV